jgi:hypothetical protein
MHLLKNVFWKAIRLVYLFVQLWLLNNAVSCPACTVSGGRLISE